MSGINTNVASLFAQNNLAKTGKSLGTAIARLSSGLRVNSAKDDAAGLAISERFRSQIIGKEVAKRNANDAISALETAEGALGSITDSLQRMRELAVQASTGTLVANDREQLNLEYQQLSAEVKRIVKDTNFNGIELLTTAAKDLDIQIGDQNGNKIEISVGDIENAVNTALGVGKSAAITANPGTTNGQVRALTLGDITIPGPTGTGNVVDGTGAPSATGSESSTFDIDGDGKADLRLYANGAGRFGSFELLDANGSLIGAKTNFATARATFDAVTLADLGVSDTKTATDVAASGKPYEVKVGAVNIALTAASGNFTNATYAGGDKITGDTAVNARSALDKINSLVDQVSKQRSTLGAGINRLDSVIGNLDTSITSVSAARGRIIDADFAKETANLTRAQILQQAGTSVLAQANQLPSSVLSLLG